MWKSKIPMHLRNQSIYFYYVVAGCCGVHLVNISMTLIKLVNLSEAVKCG